MRRGRWSACAAAAVLAALAAATGAHAATARQIYADFADNGRLDGHYSQADLRRALEDAAVAGYGGPAATGLRPAVERHVAGATYTERASSTLPFTGVDLMLMFAGGGTLLAGGLLLQRLGRSP